MGASTPTTRGLNRTTGVRNYFRAGDAGTPNISRHTREYAVNFKEFAACKKGFGARNEEFAAPIKEFAEHGWPSAATGSPNAAKGWPSAALGGPDAPRRKPVATFTRSTSPESSGPVRCVRPHALLLEVRPIGVNIRLGPSRVRLRMLRVRQVDDGKAT